MNLIMMRAPQFSLVNGDYFVKAIDTIKIAYPTLKVVTAEYQFYEKYINLIEFRADKLYKIRTKIYDPDILHGVEKINRIKSLFLEDSTSPSLHNIYHDLSKEIFDLLFKLEDADSVILFFDQLILEIFTLCLLKMPLEKITQFSIYLDPLAISIWSGVGLTEGLYWNLIMSNTKAELSFKNNHNLKIVP